MKRADSLRISFVAFLITLISLFPSSSAHAAVFSISQLNGTGAYNPELFGQTFTIPAGKSGTISSVSGLGYQGNNVTIPSVIWAKIWNSPSKTTLIATSSNTYTGTTNPSGWTPVAYFSLNFPSFTVIAGNTYYLEVGRNSGNGGFYVFESSGNPYSGGSVYHNGVIDTTYDLRFQFDITLGISASSPTVSVSSFANKGTSTSISATTTVAGAINFKSNGKTIPNCQRVPATGSPLTSNCSWRPAVKGRSEITVTLIPSDTESYTNRPSASAVVLVSPRSNRR